MRHEALANSLATTGRVVLENCLTSNFFTGALAKQTGNPAASLKYHPLPKFLALGVPVTLSTDDPGLFNTSLLGEYSHAASLGLSKETLLKLAEQSFLAAFLAP